ncbi:MAG: chloride channel protein, partial [Alphaproteobacteria bacterium]|nr:chloride channel protein [Alphaproteobacteria bacterium]
NVLGKMALTALALVGGASVGREGPTVQVGAGLLYLAGIHGRIDAGLCRSLILAGAAAGVAAAFNTPLAGIVFAIEEMARAFEQKHNSVVLTAIIFAGASSLSILGNYSYFGYANGNFVLSRDFLAIMALGVGGGVLGGVFSRLLVDGGARFYNFCRTNGLGHPAVFGAVCGLTIALLGLATHDATYGSGYMQAKAFLYGQAHGSWLYTIAKMFATAISGFSGMPGGIFSPSLSVGAALGASSASWFPMTPVEGMVILGMTAYFAGVTQAPITAFIIVLEITGGESLPVPLIATAVIAARLSRRICPVSLYHALAKDFVNQVKRDFPRRPAKPAPTAV